MYLIIGLGNPGKEYELTRHNVGRIILKNFADANADSFCEWEDSGKAKALFSKGKIDKSKVELIMPETFMNNSGKAVLYVKNKHKTNSDKIVVIYDDLDLGIGSFKISFNKSSGGHKGLDSIIKSLKTKEFVRIRVGISAITPTGKLKKPRGEKKVLDWVMKTFRKSELGVLKKLSKQINEVLEVIVKEGRAKAMNKFN